MLFVLAVLVLLLQASNGCSPSTVGLDTTKDPPQYVSGSSGILAPDTLTLIFNWNTYGPEADVTYDPTTGLSCITAGCSGSGDGQPTTFVRYVDTANTGFVDLSDASSLCSRTLASRLAATSPASGVGYNSSTYELAGCPADYTEQVETWSTLKSVCGSSYFSSSNSSSAYIVNFIYRVTYIEQLSTGDTRSVSNDFPFLVTAPTTFDVSDASYNLTGITTEIVAQQVTVDGASGSISVRVTTVSACGNVFAVPLIPVGAIDGFPAATLNATASAVSQTRVWTTVAASGASSALTITVHNTAAFPSTGSVTIVSADGSSVSAAYTGTTSTTFTGVSGAPAVSVGDTVLFNAPSTIVSGSSYFTDSSTIEVSSTSGFPSTGTLAIVDTGITYVVTYTGTTGTTFTGCTTFNGHFALADHDAVTLLDSYSAGPEAGLCATSWVLIVPLHASGPCSLDGTVNVLYSITPAGSKVSFTSPVRNSSVAKWCMHD